MFKLHRPLRPTTFTPKNLDTLEVCDKQDLIIYNGTPQHLNHNIQHCRNKKVTSTTGQPRMSDRTGQHQLYETQNVRSHWSTPDIWNSECPIAMVNTRYMKPRMKGCVSYTGEWMFTCDLRIEGHDWLGIMKTSYRYVLTYPSWPMK